MPDIINYFLLKLLFAYARYYKLLFAYKICAGPKKLNFGLNWEEWRNSRIFFADFRYFLAGLFSTFAFVFSDLVAISFFWTV